MKKLAELSLLGVAVPEEWGGAGLDNVGYALAMEEISRGCASTGVIMSREQLALLRPGAEVRHRGAEAASGSSPSPAGEKLGCFGLTEPEAGSDAAAQKTIAVTQGRQLRHQRHEELDHQRPEGRRHRALRHDRQGGGAPRASRPSSCPPTPRASTARTPDEKMGIRAALSCSIFFEDMEVPAKNLLGKEGDGFKVAMSTLDGGRIGIAAQALGIARAAFEEALRLRAGAQDLRQAHRASTRRSSSCSPTWRPRSTPRGC